MGPWASGVDFCACVNIGENGAWATIRATVATLAHAAAVSCTRAGPLAWRAGGQLVGLSSPWSHPKSVCGPHDAAGLGRTCLALACTEHFTEHTSFDLRPYRSTQARGTGTAYEKFCPAVPGISTST